MVYNIINSVKGGCGKTTLSIWLALYLQNNAPDKIRGDSCIIDMDLQGSSLVSLCYGGNNIKKTQHYLHEWIRGYEIDGKKFIEEFEVKDNGFFSVVFSSPKQKDKNMFYAGARSNYSPVLEYSTFRLGINRLLKSEEFTAKKLKHIIFDMPPNADGYSDSVLECVLNPKYKVLKDKDKVNLFMMITLDKSHMTATINWIKELYTESNNELPDKLFIVFNNNIVSSHSKESGIECYKQRKQYIEKELNLLSISDNNKKKIYFCIMNPNTAYSDFCIAGIGLVNCNTNLRLDNVLFAKFAAYGSDNFKDDPKEFVKLLAGVENEN